MSTARRWRKASPALETVGEVRDGAWVAELAGDILQGWPKGMRLNWGSTTWMPPRPG
jgi:hypothetical protein